MLNLRQLDSKIDTLTAGQSLDFSAPRFRGVDSIFANFGGPLDHGTPFTGEDDEGSSQSEGRAPKNGALELKTGDGVLRENSTWTGYAEGSVEVSTT